MSARRDSEKNQALESEEISRETDRDDKRAQRTRLEFHGANFGNLHFSGSGSLSACLRDKRSMGGGREGRGVY